MRAVGNPSDLARGKNGAGRVPVDCSSAHNVWPANKLSISLFSEFLKLFVGIHDSSTRFLPSSETLDPLATA